MRFDDTNPVKENIDYINSIISDVKWLLGDKNIGEILYASDYFEQMYCYALDLIKKENKQIKNIDVQIILQEPKLVKYLESIKENIGKLLNLNSENINVKVTSTDKLGLIGSGEGIGTLCAVNLIKL